jgi:hypothetical protein
MYTAVSLHGSELLHKVMSKLHLSGNRLLVLFFLFIYALFNVAVSSSDCIALNGIIKQ